VCALVCGPLSLRHFEEMMVERNVIVDHATGGAVKGQRVRTLFMKRSWSAMIAFGVQAL
jgi:transposase-like protein